VHSSTAIIPLYPLGHDDPDDVVGEMVGDMITADLLDFVGVSAVFAVGLGVKDGLLLGSYDGSALGSEEGLLLGSDDGSALGSEEGLLFGSDDGPELGSDDGSELGSGDG